MWLTLIKLPHIGRELEHIIQVAGIVGGDDSVSILNEEIEKLIEDHRVTFIKENVCFSLLYLMGNLSDFQEYWL